MTARQALRKLSTVMIVAGTIILADALLTLAWQEPITALVAKLRQDGLQGDLERLRRAPLPERDRRALATLRSTRAQIDFLAGSLRRRAERGSAVGRLRIARTGTDQVVVRGADPASLRHGPGLYGDTPFPGEGGTTAIAGHRTTFGAPFRHVDELEPGDRIVLTMPYAEFTYRVQERRIVAPGDLRVLEHQVYDRLVLSACHPLYSASERIVVLARLERTLPAGLAQTRVQDPQAEAAGRR